MEPSPGSALPPPQPPRWRRALVLAVVAAGIVAGAWALWPRPRHLPAVTEASPYLNTRPGVKYVGDKACVQCHEGHVELYHDHHPMARSLLPPEEASPLERYDNKAAASFDRHDGHFEVRRVGKKVVHREAVRAGKEDLATLEAPIAYAMGSGHSGRSYIVNRDGWLVQSPISWYSHRAERDSPMFWFFPKPSWDLSPGYEKGRLNFSRLILPRCMFCHADVVTPIENTLNRYTQPLFERQSAIGCERCHGPGELHVASHRRGDASKPDLTIVNPARLAPALREAVCQQCHLQGEAQIVRRGKALFDYRPGLPLHEFVTIFVKAPHLSDSRKAVSHTEEMYSSRCFQGTKGKANALGCVSCHDPHQLPMPEARVEHYRSSCLKCHGETSCHLEPAARKKLQADDSCIACHMQAARSNIPHAAITDHRISRRPDQPPKPKKELQWAGIGLLHFHRDLVDADKEDIGRDLGVALIEMAREMGTDTPTVTNLARSALAFLENGLEEHPDDLDARESQIYGLCCLGQQEGAYPLLKHLLEQVPDRERALDDAVRIATYLGRTEEALRYGRRLLKVNPWQPRYRAEMANVHARRQEWADAIRECKESLRLDPTSETTRSLLVSCYIRMGDKKNAQLEFKRIMAMGPRDPKGLRTWFDNEMK